MGMSKPEMAAGDGRHGGSQAMDFLMGGGNAGYIDDLALVFQPCFHFHGFL